MRLSGVERLSGDGRGETLMSQMTIGVVARADEPLGFQRDLVGAFNGLFGPASIGVLSRVRRVLPCKVRQFTRS